VAALEAGCERPRMARTIVEYLQSVRYVMLTKASVCVKARPYARSRNVSSVGQMNTCIARARTHAPGTSRGCSAVHTDSGMVTFCSSTMYRDRILLRFL
jgi:hypothetical protein